MDTKTFELIGKNNKTLNLVAPSIIELPSLYVTEYKSYCGPGSGIGDYLVPEHIFWVPISPACYIHDFMWEIGDPTWEYFHFTNSVFLSNLITLIQVQSSSRFLKRLRLYHAVTYYNFVDSVGKTVFWNLMLDLNNITEDLFETLSIERISER